ncbi:ParM/StbA family protein [Desulfofundulus sp. TPOSR]|uniref:ParM/StbA family protein n=1 Tax=Desulfofundulus sp. TPOSR TaxID=2714340 RepID=UPI00140D5DF1|nr:ParM/StbA family protein [Desulfofundulus sp. TPOSR]NHM26987.1 ParM/StbA family protein [Desulfofundulus sp. TPOSR]
MIAIDVGYSHTKAVSPDRRVLIPSVVAPYSELPLAELSRNGSGHVVEIRRLNGDTKNGVTKKYFVGELALREGQGATFTLDREKHRHPNHDILVLAAARLLEAREGATLVVGLPVAYYRLQKEELRKQLEALHAKVSVDDGPLARVSFGKVVVYPQGAGALLTASDLPENSLICLVDVGFKTTDYVLAKVAGGMVGPEGGGSVEYGVFQMYETVAAAFGSETGAPLDMNVAAAVAAQGRVTFRGRELDLTASVKAARVNTARAIADRVLAALGQKGDFVAKFYLAGGGAVALPELTDMFPAAEVLPDPQWANAEGFLRVVTGTLKSA